MKKKYSVLMLAILIVISLLMGCVPTNKSVDNDDNKEAQNLSVSLGKYAKIDEKEIEDVYGDDAELINLINQFVGYKAPNLTITDLDGNEVNISDFKGENVILEFMGTWCPVCEESVSNIEDYNENYEKAKIISVSLNEEVEDVEKFIEEKNIKNIDYYLANENVEDVYSIRFVPLLFFIDKEQIVQFIMAGDISSDMLQVYSDKAF